MARYINTSMNILIEAAFLRAEENKNAPHCHPFGND